jgi:hypothetical protein
MKHQSIGRLGRAEDVAKMRFGYAAGRELVIGGVTLH